MIDLPKDTRSREDGRLQLIKMPSSPEERDKLPGPMEHHGRRQRWVGIGWVDEGPADGTEPLVWGEE